MTEYFTIDIIFPHKGSFSSLISTLLRWENFFSFDETRLSRLLLVTSQDLILEKEKIFKSVKPSFFEKILFIEDIKLSGVYPAWNQALPHIIGSYVIITGTNDGPNPDASISSVIRDIKYFATKSSNFCLSYAEERCLSDSNLIFKYRKSNSNIPLPLKPFIAFLSIFKAKPIRYCRRFLLLVSTLRGLPIHMQSTIFPATLLKTAKFDESLSIASDYKFWCSSVSKIDVYFSNQCAFIFDLAGISVQRRDDMILESYMIARQCFGAFAAITFAWLKFSSFKKKLL